MKISITRQYAQMTVKAKMTTKIQDGRRRRDENSDASSRLTLSCKTFKNSIAFCNFGN